MTKKTTTPDEDLDGDAIARSLLLTGIRGSIRLPKEESAGIASAALATVKIMKKP